VNVALTVGYMYLGYEHGETFIFLLIEATMIEYIPSLFVYIPAICFLGSALKLNDRTGKLVNVVIENKEALL
jgi:hypothetical protein